MDVSMDVGMHVGIIMDMNVGVYRCGYGCKYGGSCWSEGVNVSMGIYAGRYPIKYQHIVLVRVPFKTQATTTIDTLRIAEYAD